MVSASPAHQSTRRQSSSISFQQLPLEVEPDSVHNIHITYNDQTLDGELSLVYGPCGDDLVTTSDSDSGEIDHHHHHIGTTHIGAHPLAARHTDWEDQRPKRFVWVTPSDAGSAESEQLSSCVHALLDGEHVGRSEEVRIVSSSSSSSKERRKRSTSFADVADPMGPWFDGVAYLKQKQPNETFVAATKSKRFGILGAGMAGLTTGVSFFVS